MGRLMNSERLARLFAALDSVEATRDLIGQIRQAESFLTERSELATIAERVGEAREMLRSLIVAERGR